MVLLYCIRYNQLTLHMNQCWNNVNWTPWTNFIEILISIHTSSIKKMHFKMSSVKCQHFCLPLLNFLPLVAKYMSENGVSRLFCEAFYSIHIIPRIYPYGASLLTPIHYTPCTMNLWGGYIGFTPSIHLSVRPSVHPSRIPCPLCSTYSSCWIHFIFMYLIKQLQKVCCM